MTPLDARQARRRYLLLLALRWLPTGLLVPVTTLIALDRGLSLLEVGSAIAVQGIVVAVLELPTGGLADALGRRPVLVVAGVAGVASLAVLAVADSVAGFALAWGLQGVFRALDSGPLEAWYVDTARAAAPGLRLDRALSAGGTVLGLAVSTGALGSGLLVAYVDVPGVPPTAVPVYVALVLQAIGLGALALIPEPARPRGSVLRAVRAVPAVVVDGVRIVRGSRALAGLTAVAFLWGVGMVAFETLLPARLAELTGGTAPAAALLGPATAAAWLVSAAGAAAAPWLASRVGLVGAAVGCRVLQGATVVAMGLLAGPAGAITGLLLTYLVHGAANPLHSTLVHREVDDDRRATMLSIRSLVAQLGFATGLITLTALADATTTETAIVPGGVVLAAAAPLYLLGRPPRRRPVRATGLGESAVPGDRR